MTAVAECGDRKAFAALFDYYAPRLNAYLRRLGADAGHAEELAQEVMVTVWRKAALFDRRKSSLATWLFRIARNRRIDALRRDRSDALDPNDPMMLPEPPVPADEALDGRAREARIREALAALPGEQVSLIELAFYRGFSHSQIAERTGLPLGTVKSRIRLAFHRLRRVLESDGVARLESE